MPSTSSVFRWLDSVPAFRERYARARQEQAETFADEIVALADRDDLDPQDKRVRVDARKWVAAKLKPKVYGDSQQTSSTNVNVAVGIVCDETQRARIIAQREKLLGGAVLLQDDAGAGTIAP